MTHNVEMILDAHTHLTGSEEPDQILECMNACAVEKAFLFAPERHIVEEGSPTREEYRSMIFFGNAYSHWQDTIREPQRPRTATESIEMPHALQGHSHG